MKVDASKKGDGKIKKREVKKKKDVVRAREKKREKTE